jgi:hypothetical protein
LPPERWATAMRRDEFFRPIKKPIKKQITARIDADVLDWLKSKGGGHLSRINEIVRREMMNELRLEAITALHLAGVKDSPANLAPRPGRRRVGPKSRISLR